MEKKDILESLINYYTDGNKAKFAAKLGVKPQTINTWIGRNSFDVELAYSKCEGVSGDWLLSGGEGSMLQSSPPASEPRIVATDEESYEAAKRQGVEMIPEYDVEFHGGDGIISLSEPIIAMWSVPGVPTDTYIIQIKGDSMAPLLKSGTRVAVRPRSLVSSALELPFGEIYAVAVYDEDGNNHTHIKYLRRHPDPAKENTHWIARSVNREEYDDFEIPIARVHLLGRVIMSVNFL